MTNDSSDTPNLQTEPVMDGAMDHKGPPPMTDSDGHTVDLSRSGDEEQTAKESGAGGPDDADDVVMPEAD